MTRGKFLKALENLMQDHYITLNGEFMCAVADLAEFYFEGCPVDHDEGPLKRFYDNELTLSQLAEYTREVADTMYEANINKPQMESVATALLHLIKGSED